MPSPRARTRIVVAVIAGLGAIVLPGCKGSKASICERRIACEGGNDADIDACEEALSGDEGVAGAYDCGEAFAKWLECVDEHGVCATDKDKPRFTDSDLCKALEDTTESCEKGASARR